MADTADIEVAIVSLVAQAVYPDGVNSSVGSPVKVYRGWAIPAQLDADLAGGTLNVSVYATDTESKTTRHQPRWIDIPVAANGQLTTAALKVAGQNCARLQPEMSAVTPTITPG